MLIRGKHGILKKKSRHLVLCEGYTEFWYLKEILNSQLVKVDKSKYSNAKQLVSEGNDRQKEIPVENRIYCVFDHDRKSNSDQQLMAANECIEGSKGKLQRIFSNPCFEVALWFNSITTSKIFANCADVEANLSQKFGKKYAKNEKSVKLLSKETNFNQICVNTKMSYDQLKVNATTWLTIEDGYSEIFKLEPLAIK